MSAFRDFLIAILALAALFGARLLDAQAAPPTRKEKSMFVPAQAIERARNNARKYPWAAEIQKQILQAAQPWKITSDDALWDRMFGNTIKRAWQVWSNGYCPVCKKSVPMYDWQMDALNQPWKTRCPHCKELFPKNDFGKFYRSGLDEHGIFDPKRADRSLLFNTEHPDSNDPLHNFGVDDGEGYAADGHRWRFIGAYLIFGQWKQGIVNGIVSLAAAYTVTGDKVYAHKAGVLLDRAADLYPTMDFGKEGVMYEGAPRSGYVSTWHDACYETRAMALAYDQVREAIAQDKELATFLSRQAKKVGLTVPKATPADICANIEERILRDATRSLDKIYSNYPETDVTVAIIKTILDWPASRDEVYGILDGIIEKASATDGLSGEKGLAGYSVIAPHGTANILALFSRIDPNVLPDMLKRHPRLHAMYRFHIDTWCLQKYYPQIGDTGGFAAPVTQYVGVAFTKNPGFMPSMYAFLWQLYELTGDAALAQALYKANDEATEGLPYDLFADDPAAFQKRVREVIAKEGAAIKVGSVNKQQWHLAILRGGEGKDARALWMDYDSGGFHAHADGMNIGLFAKGLDLLPDFGYPPVGFGGWGAPRARWYMMSAAHNTVVVDAKNHRNKGGSYQNRSGFEGQPYGKTTLWADGKTFRAIRASGPEITEAKQFERALAAIDLSDNDFYVLDVFRVVGGSDHAKFLHSHFGTITTQGLSLQSAEEYGHGAQMRGFQQDANPKPGWSVDWKIEDRYKLLPPASEVHLRYTDLTPDAQAFTAEAWVTAGGYIGDEAWIPCILTRRQAKNGAELASTFVGVLEPYEKTSRIASLRRLPLETPEGTAFPDANTAIEVRSTEGVRDLFLTADTENPLGLSPSFAAHPTLVQKECGVRIEGETGFVRWDKAGKVERIALCNGASAQIGDVTLVLKAKTDFVEIRLEGERATLLSGSPASIKEIRVQGRNIWQNGGGEAR